MGSLICSSGASMELLLGCAGLGSAATCSHPCCGDSGQMHVRQKGSEYVCISGAQIQHYCSHLPLLLLPVQTLPLHWFLLVLSHFSSRPQEEGSAFHTQPNPTQPNKTQSNSTQPKAHHRDCNRLTARTVAAQLWVVASGTWCWHSLSAVPGGAGNASPSPFSASAHKAAGVGCLLFSLQPGM